jgi:hypothetical protein
MKRFIIICLMMMAAYSLYAADWTAKSVMHDPETDRGDLKGFRDDAGHFFFVEDGMNVSENEAATILKMKDVFFSWQGVSFREIRFSVEGAVINAVVLPAEMKNETLDYIPYLPAGMFFYYQNESIQYNFRLKKDTYFIRINGAYISEKVLFDKMSEAIRTPQTFVQRRDPDYMLSQIDRLNQETDMLKKAVIALNNKSFFSNRGPIDPGTVNKVVAMKIQNPSMTVSQIEEALVKEKIKIQTSEIVLILNVYFNEFPK